MAISRFNPRAMYGMGGRRRAYLPEEIERARTPTRRTRGRGRIAYTPPTLDTSQLTNMQLEYNRQMAARDTANRAYYQRQMSEMQQRADLSQYNAARKAGYQPQPDQYGRTRKQVAPALLERVMNAEPSGYRVAFNEMIPRQGDEFIDYMMEEGVVPYFGSGRGSVSGRWTDYLLNRFGVGSYGVNPYAKPLPQQAAPPPGYGGYGGRGGGGGGAAYEPEPPKQYGDRGTYAQRNIPQWLMDMVVWQI